MKYSLACLAAILSACSSSSAPDATTGTDPVCDAIMERCHPVDVGTGMIHTCHEIALADQGAACRANQADCFAACVPPADGGALPDVPAHAMDGHGGH